MEGLNLKFGKKVKRDKIKLADIKHIANSRFRDVNDVSDLISDIKVNGQLQAIGVRIEDNALIFGNRRVAAMVKMGLEEADADFYEGVSDLQLLAMNISENHKRKNITPAEYGRAIWMMKRQDSTLTNPEVAALLSIAPSRVAKLLKIYDVVAGTPFENVIVQGNKIHGIPEQFVSDCYTKLSRPRINGKLSERDWCILLEAAKNRELTLQELTPLRKILFTKPNIQMELAIQMLKRCKVLNVFIGFDLSVLHEEMDRCKIDSEIEFIKHVIRQYNNKLVF